MSKQIKKVKRKLADDFESEVEAGPSGQNKRTKSKADQIRNESQTCQQSVGRPGKNSSLSSKRNLVKRPSLSKNNNATIKSRLNGKTIVENTKTRSNENPKSRSNGLSKTVTVLLPKKIVKKKVTPIIQTRKMKAKSDAMQLQKELEKLNKIDVLSSAELDAGERVLENDSDVDHDGVELSIQGSDLSENPCRRCFEFSVSV